MLGVGIPVWAIHWLLIQRGLAVGKPDRLAEHGSAIRAGYLTLVLAVSLLLWVSSAGTVLVALIWSASGGGSSFLYNDSVSAASTATVAFVVWLYHGLVRRGDLGAGPVSGAAAWLPRLYLYGVSLGVVVSISGLQALTSSLFGSSSTGYARLSAIRRPSFGGWGVVWAAHWWYATRLAAADGAPRAGGERALGVHRHVGRRLRSPRSRIRPGRRGTGRSATSVRGDVTVSC
jgi:hypothetical protein